MNRKTLPLPVPSAMFKLAGSMVGKTKEIDRLLGSLVVDDSHLRNQLDWTPPQTFQQGAKETTAWFLKEKDV